MAVVLRTSRRDEGKRREPARPDTIILHDQLRNRMDNCPLLGVMNKLYKKEYGLSAKRYLSTASPQESDGILSVLERAPPSIAKMFRRRLRGKGKKNKERWTPMIPIPAVRRKGDREFFVEEWDGKDRVRARPRGPKRKGAKDNGEPNGFHVDFPRLAEAGRLLYTTMKPSEYLEYAFAGELIEKRAKDGAPGTESNVKRKKEHIKSGTPLKTPFLRLDLSTGRVVFHDGRHRAVAAEERGVKRIPVMIEYDPPGNEKELRCLQDRTQWRRELTPSHAPRAGK